MIFKNKKRTTNPISQADTRTHARKHNDGLTFKEFYRHSVDMTYFGQYSALQ